MPQPGRLCSIGYGVHEAMLIDLRRLLGHDDTTRKERQFTEEAELYDKSNEINISEESE